MGGLKIKGLIAALNSLAISRAEFRDNNGKAIPRQEYPPTIKEIVEKYDELKRLQEQQIREKKIAEDKKLMLIQVEGQYKCNLCDNTGNYIYKAKINDRNGIYDFFCRCICTRGRDLNKWSECQITKGKLYVDPVSKKEKSIYVPDLKDIFTDEEIEIIKIKKMNIQEDKDFNKGKEMIENIKSNFLVEKIIS